MAQRLPPGIAGFVAGNEIGQQDQQRQLQAMGVLAQLQAQQEAQAQAREMRPLQLQQMQGQLAKSQADQAREQEFRSGIAALGPTPDQGLLSSLAARYASPDKVMSVQQSALDRKAAQENALVLGREKTADRKEEFNIRQQDARERQQAGFDQQRSMAQFAAGLRQPPVPRQLQLTADAQGNQLIVNPDGTTRPLTAADGSVIKKPGPSERAMPPSLSNKYLENVQNLRKAEQAVTLLEGKDIGVTQGDTQATGKKGLLTSFGVVGDKTLNWFDPKGVDTRAAVGDLGSMVIHDRSGAAVTAAEFPRLRPFIPLSSDSPEVALKKTRRFAQEYKAEVEAQQEFFKESGYKVPNVQTRRATDAAAGEWKVVR